ncbi:MAG: DUF3343 domain-containing protein [Acetobacter sp.]|nr:DUF3343 domain-containing protein [Bacteroides sp.]MCM1341347.1 DUF3343 domain-containing protein [Acetobacter sp.]MCM1433439.1 DUF3343 domain-containing protein [Clostridiales bacterium]
MNILIKVGSITNAQRSVKILSSKGYKAGIQRLQNPKASDGCGYGVKVRADSDEPIRILEKAGINVRGVEEL